MYIYIYVYIYLIYSGGSFENRINERNRINNTNKKLFYVSYLNYFIKFPAAFGKGTQVKINIRFMFVCLFS